MDVGAKSCLKHPPPLAFVGIAAAFCTTRNAWAQHHHEGLDPSAEVATNPPTAEHQAHTDMDHTLDGLCASRPRKASLQPGAASHNSAIGVASTNPPVSVEQRAMHWGRRAALIAGLLTLRRSSWKGLIGPAESACDSKGRQGIDEPGRPWGASFVAEPPDESRLRRPISLTCGATPAPVGASSGSMD
jgi:hypothetical protein